MSTSGATYALGAMGLLALAGAARSPWSGAFNRPMLAQVPFRLHAEREGRAPNALRVYAWLPNARISLRTAAGGLDAITIFGSPSGYQVLAIHPQGTHLAWERFTSDGRLVDDRFLHGSQIARVLGASWHDLKPADLCTHLSNLSARAEYGHAV